MRDVTEAREAHRFTHAHSFHNAAVLEAPECRVTLLEKHAETPWII